MSRELFKVEVEGTTFEIEVDDAEGTISVDGKPIAASVVPVSGDTYSLIVDGSSHEFTLARNGTTRSVSGIGRTVEVAVYDRIAQLLLESQSDGRHVHSTQVRAPMPGLVLKLEVEVGDEVHAGSGLLVLEAMKMENEIFATGEAEVEAIHVEPGNAVSKGQLLVTLK